MSFPNAPSVKQALLDQGMAEAAHLVDQFTTLAVSQESTIEQQRLAIRQLEARATQRKDEIATLHEQIRTLKSRVETMAAHPDVKRVRIQELQRQKAEIEAELASLQP